MKWYTKHHKPGRLFRRDVGMVQKKYVWCYSYLGWLFILHSSGKCFRDSLKNCLFYVLWHSCSLSYNEISDEGTCALAGALQVNQSLQELEWVQLFVLRGVHACNLLGRAWVSPTLAWLHCTDVCVYDCACGHIRTINFKSAFKCFSKIERPRALAWQCWPTARVQRWQL